MAEKKKIERLPQHGVGNEFGETVPYYHGADEPVHAPRPDDGDDREPAL